MRAMLLHTSLLPLLAALLLVHVPPSVAAATPSSGVVLTGVFSYQGSSCPLGSRLLTLEEAATDPGFICSLLAPAAQRFHGLAGGCAVLQAGTICIPMSKAQLGNSVQLQFSQLCMPNATSTTTAPAATFAAATSKQQAVQLVKNDKVLRSLLTASGLDQNSQADFDASFESWAAYYKYTFKGAALEQARSNFLSNLRTIAKVNANPAVPHWLGANQFAHLSPSQFGQRAPLDPGSRPGTIGRLLHGVTTGEAAASRAARMAAALGSLGAAPGNLPQVKNWVAEGKVTPVRNQYGGQPGNNGCGSCWAFTTVAAIESAYLISKGINASAQPDLHLSEEQVLDCCNPDYSPGIAVVSGGCNAGSVTEAMTYAAANPLTTSFRIGYSSVDHPNTPGTSGMCDPGAIRRIAAERGQAVQLSGPKGYREIMSKSKTAMMQALAQGPVAVYFDSSPLQFYKGGVFVDECGIQTNHAMLVVGYNTVGDQLSSGGFSAPYWLIKNQFGAEWGDKGYIKVAIQDDGTSGTCGMYLGPTQVIPSFVPGLDTLFATPPYPSPPPAPPPGPPPVQPWPNCEPGNTNETMSFSWTVSLQSATSTQLTLRVQPNQACRPAGSACCQSSLQHIQLRVQGKCYANLFPLMSSPDFPDGSLQGVWPDAPNILDVEFPGSGRTISSVQTSISITLTVDATNKACPNLRSFFTNFNFDQYTYAAFGNRDQCCGTDVMAPVSKDTVDCQVAWQPWGPCSASCGGGTQVRYGIISQQASNGGASCPPLTNTQACNTQDCSTTPTPTTPTPVAGKPVDCQVAWQPWSPCSATCGGGLQSRAGAISQQPANGGASCPPLTSQQPCNTQACSASPASSPTSKSPAVLRINCQVAWQPWGPCSSSCGGGAQARTGIITQRPYNGGEPCPSLDQRQPCNTQACSPPPPIVIPVDCQVAWQPWSPCSATCGGGVQSRTGAISQQPANGGANCPPLTSQQPCNTQACPARVDCKVAWQPWGPCSALCGGGTQSRYGIISQQASNGGAPCPPLTNTQACNTQGCSTTPTPTTPTPVAGKPVDCQVAWQPWSPCSASCGGGAQSRYGIISQHASNGGASCPPLTNTQACNTQDCPVPPPPPVTPVDCQVAWQAWGPCNTPCGGGIQVQIGSITQRPSNGGASCPTLTNTKACNTQICSPPPPPPSPATITLSQVVCNGVPLDVRTDSTYLEIERTCTGVLPKDLSLLTKLQRLAAIYNPNQMTGSLPKEWSVLTDLKEVAILGNQITGSLPKEWSVLANFGYIFAHYNNITGSLPEEWSALTNLKEVDLGGNEITGTMPKEWSTLTNLNGITLYSNQITGRLPKEWSTLTTITGFRVYLNQISGSLPKEWSVWTNVKYFYSMTNRITGSLPEEWSKWSSLIYLEEYYNQITGSLPKEWSAMVNLEGIFASNNGPLTGSLPKEWSVLTNLKDIDVHNNKITGSLPKEWSTLTKLTGTTGYSW